MRSRGGRGKGTRVGECEVATTYKSYKSYYTHKTHIQIIQIYYTYIQNTHIPLHICENTMHAYTFTNLSFLFPSLHIYRASIYKPYPTYTYIFAALYIHDMLFLVTFPYLD
nr:MAG TPA: hypothetical protein [Caudoviricetes sp.]